jgi:hypothetical protein
MVGLTPLIVLRVPYYSWIIVLVLLIFSIVFLKEIIATINRRHSFDSPGLLFLIGFLLLFLVPYALRDEGYLDFNLLFIIAVPNALLLSVIGTAVYS